MEKRQFSRILFDSDVTVRLGSTAISGQIENLSMKGALLITEYPFNLKDVVFVELRLSGNPDPLVLELQGIVVRCDKGKAAVQFTGMDPDTFIHLKNIMAYNQGDESVVREELANFMSEKQ